MKWARIEFTAPCSIGNLSFGKGETWDGPRERLIRDGVLHVVSVPAHGAPFKIVSEWDGFEAAPALTDAQRAVTRKLYGRPESP